MMMTETSILMQMSGQRIVQVSCLTNIPATKIGFGALHAMINATTERLLIAVDTTKIHMLTVPIYFQRPKTDIHIDRWMDRCLEL